jgi:hydrogenase nickel incorporation protein HypA/HybF
MHELSIAMSIIDMASEEASRRGARIEAIHLKLGPLCGVIKEALVSAYELAREGSALDGSRLEIEDVPIVTWCDRCQAERTVASVQEIVCSVCGAPTPDIRKGRELEIVALEISS